MSGEFNVDTATHLFGSIPRSCPSFAIKLGNLETRLFKSEISGIRIVKPVFICGLARSGTTITLEYMASLPGAASHKYRDFPLVHTPIFWNRFLELAPRRPPEPAERSHNDGIMVTEESPEAMEEPIWMSFFKNAHDPSSSNVLDSRTANGEFEAFFRDHIKKILFLRNGSRYVSKGNYNIARMEYLLKIFPDALFIIPIRDPASHIASLVKQQKLFTSRLENNPRGIAYLKGAGHFEFGPIRKPINTGNGCAAEIQSLWNSGREIEGWSKYWSCIHKFIAERLASNTALKRAALVVPYDRLCGEPEKCLTAIARHACFAGFEEKTAEFSKKIRAPAYYKPSFSNSELDTIRALTREAFKAILDLASDIS